MAREWVAVASAGQYASLHLAPDNHASTPPVGFYRPDALPSAQPTASKHWRPCLWMAVMHDIYIVIGTVQIKKMMMMISLPWAGFWCRSPSDVDIACAMFVCLQLCRRWMAVTSDVLLHASSCMGVWVSPWARRMTLKWLQSVPSGCSIIMPSTSYVYLPHYGCFMFLIITYVTFRSKC